MNFNVNSTADLDRLAVLDPAVDRQPSAEEWARSRAHVDRVISGQYDERVAPSPRRPVWQRRLVLVGAAAAAAVAASVAVPTLVPTTADKAFASWTAQPTAVTGQQVLPTARACARAWNDSGADPSDVLLAEQRGHASLLIMKTPDGTAECLSFEPGTAGPSMGLTEGPLQPPAGDGIRLETRSSAGGGGGLLHTLRTLGDGPEWYSNFIGSAGPGVSAVDLMMGDGRVIHTSMSAGWFAAWWPGDEGGLADGGGMKVVVHTTSGATKTYNLAQLSN